MPRRSAPVVAIAAGSLMLTLGACASDDADREDLEAACETVSSDGDVLVCEALYSEGAPLQLPTDEGHVYGGLAQFGDSFVTADGSVLEMDEALKDELGSDREYASTVYEATVTDGAVTDATPVMTISESAILDSVFGGTTMVGTISKAVDEFGFDGQPSVPVAIEFEPEASGNALAGRIVNAENSVKGSDGSCIASLSDLGAEDPIHGAFGEDITIERHPSMHAPFGDEMVLVWAESSSGMGAEFYPSVGTLLGGDDLESPWGVTQHGSPTSGPGLSLAFADGPTEDQC